MRISHRLRKLFLSFDFQTGSKYLTSRMFKFRLSRKIAVGSEF